MKQQEASSILQLKMANPSLWEVMSSYLNNRLNGLLSELETTDSESEFKRVQGKVRELREIIKLDETAQAVMDLNSHR